MELSLSKLPWYAQIGAFVLVSAGAVFGFWNFYVAEISADIDLRAGRLTQMRADIAKGNMTARQLPQFQSQVAELQSRLENLRQVLPDEKDVADILRRIEGLAVKSNLKIQRFQPAKVVQQKLYAEIPYRLEAEGTYHNLGAFFDQISKFPRIINVGEITIKAKAPPEQNRTIVAECTATTFVLQEGAVGGRGQEGRCPSNRRSTSECGRAHQESSANHDQHRAFSRGGLPPVGPGADRRPAAARGAAAGGEGERRGDERDARRRRRRRPTATTPRAGAIRSSAWSRGAAIPGRRQRGRRDSRAC